MTAGYDPYDVYVRRQEIAYERRMADRPHCNTCGDRIEGESEYVIGDSHYCEDCFDGAIHTLRKALLPLVEEKYKHHTDGEIIVDLVESIVDNFDFTEWKTDHEEVFE